MISGGLKMNLIKELNIKNRYSIKIKASNDISENTILECIESPERFHDIGGFYSIIIKDIEKDEYILVSDITSTNKIYYKKDHTFASFDINIPEKTPVELSEKAIRYYLKYRYIPSPYCFYKYYRTLEPGVVLKIKKNKDEEVLSKYKIRFMKRDITFNDFKKEIEEVVKDSLKNIKKRDSGIFLSGGMDSSAVLYLLRKNCPDIPLKAFSVLFPGEKYDEDDFSDYVSEKTGVEREIFKLYPQDFIDFWQSIPDIFPQPVSTHTGAAYYKVARNTEVEHIFSGMGGDELFGGDIKYFHCEKLRKFKENMETNGLKNDIEPFEEFLGFVSFNDDEIRPKIIEQKELLDQLTWFNMRYWQTEYENYVINNICEKTGKRHIALYTDKNFIEMATSIDNELKIRGYVQRYVYRKWIETIFGKDFAFRPSQGFSAPLNRFFKNELKVFLEDSIESLCKRQVLKKIIDEKYIKNTLKELYSGKNVYNILLIHLILEMYMKGFEKNENTVHIS